MEAEVLRNLDNIEIVNYLKRATGNQSELTSMRATSAAKSSEYRLDQHSLPQRNEIASSLSLVKLVSAPFIQTICKLFIYILYCSK